VKTLISLLIIAGGLSAAADTTIKYKCNAPELDYVNRFEMSGTIVTGDVDADNPTSWVSAQTFTGAFTKSGTDQMAQRRSFKLSGRITRVASANTMKPFLNLKLKNKEKTQLIQLNLNYPNKLSSSVKTDEGRLFKSTCKIVSIETCAFGNDYFDALENPAIKKTDLGIVKKEIQAFGETVPVQKTKVTLTNGESYLMFYTFDDSVDGGNTYGQIEDMSGNIVSRIEDSDLYQCKVLVPTSL
jgi:hypothetical protein